MKAILRDFPDQFESERLIIRSPRPGDGPALNRAIIETWEELRPWMPWAGGEFPAVAETEEVVRNGHANFLARNDMMLLLFLKDTGALIGGSGLHRMDWDVPRFEIGYWRRTGYGSSGYVTEAVGRIMLFAFEELGAHRVEIHCDVHNEHSAAVARRLGFTHEGTLRNFRRHHLTGQLLDMMIFARISARNA